MKVLIITFLMSLSLFAIQNNIIDKCIKLTYAKDFNPSQTIKICKKAYQIESNNVQVINLIALSYSYKKEYKNAFKWYLKAAKKGDSYAQSRIGIIYKFGKGTKKIIQKHMNGI